MEGKQNRAKTRRSLPAGGEQLQQQSMASNNAAAATRPPEQQPLQDNKAADKLEAQKAAAMLLRELLLFEDKCFENDCNCRELCICSKCFMAVTTCQHERALHGLICNTVQFIKTMDALYKATEYAQAFQMFSDAICIIQNVRAGGLELTLLVKLSQLCLELAVHMVAPNEGINMLNAMQQYLQENATNDADIKRTINSDYKTNIMSRLRTITLSWMFSRMYALQKNATLSIECMQQALTTYEQNTNVTDYQLYLASLLMIWAPNEHEKSMSLLVAVDSYISSYLSTYFDVHEREIDAVEEISFRMLQCRTKCQMVRLLWYAISRGDAERTSTLHTMESIFLDTSNTYNTAYLWLALAQYTVNKDLARRNIESFISNLWRQSQARVDTVSGQRIADCGCCQNTFKLDSSKKMRCRGCRTMFFFDIVHVQQASSRARVWNMQPPHSMYCSLLYYYNRMMRRKEKCRVILSNNESDQNSKKKALLCFDTAKKYWNAEIENFLVDHAHYPPCLRKGYWSNSRYRMRWTCTDPAEPRRTRDDVEASSKKKHNDLAAANMAYVTYLQERQMITYAKFRCCQGHIWVQEVADVSGLQSECAQCHEKSKDEIKLWDYWSIWIYTQANNQATVVRARSSMPGDAEAGVDLRE